MFLIILETSDLGNSVKNRIFSNNSSFFRTQQKWDLDDLVEKIEETPKLRNSEKIPFFLRSTNIFSEAGEVDKLKFLRIWEIIQIWNISKKLLCFLRISLIFSEPVRWINQCFWENLIVRNFRSGKFCKKFHIFIKLDIFLMFLPPS